MDPPEWTGREKESLDDQGRKIFFTGRQISVVKNINRALDSFATERHTLPKSIWAVIGTRQSSIHPPPLTFQLGGRVVIQHLRRWMIVVLVDKIGKFMRGSIGEGDTLRFSPNSLWPTTIFAIVLSSRTEWMPLQDIKGFATCNDHSCVILD